MSIGHTFNSKGICYVCGTRKSIAGPECKIYDRFHIFTDETPLGHTFNSKGICYVCGVRKSSAGPECKIYDRFHIFSDEEPSMFKGIKKFLIRCKNSIFKIG